MYVDRPNNKPNDIGPLPAVSALYILFSSLALSSRPSQALVCSREPLSVFHLQELGLIKGLRLLPGWGTVFFLVDSKVGLLNTLYN